jgi:Flp pilus assembly pilin Flp
MKRRGAGPIAGALADERGASIIEFALVIPVFAAMVLGFMDFGHWVFVRALTDGGLEQAARSTGVGGAAVDPTVFERNVESTVKRIAATATFTWDKKSYYQFSGVNKPEKLTDDKNDNQLYDPGDCWEDLNPNGTYDTQPGRDGVGGADDVVFYKVVVSYPPLIPLAGMIPGVPDRRTVTATTIIKRQPHAAQAAPSVRC